MENKETTNKIDERNKIKKNPWAKDSIFISYRIISPTLLIIIFFFFCLVYMKVRSRYVLSRRFSSYVIVFQSFNVVYWLVYDPESAFHFFFFYGRHRLFWRWSYWLSRKIPVFSLWKNERQTCESQPTEKEKKTFSHLLDAVVIVFSDQLV